MQATAELSNLASSLAVKVKVVGRREVGPLPDAPTSAAESAEHPLLPQVVLAGRTVARPAHTVDDSAGRRTDVPGKSKA